MNADNSNGDEDFWTERLKSLVKEAGRPRPPPEVRTAVWTALKSHALTGGLSVGAKVAGGGVVVMLMGASFVAGTLYARGTQPQLVHSEPPHAVANQAAAPPSPPKEQPAAMTEPPSASRDKQTPVTKFVRRVKAPKGEVSAEASDEQRQALETARQALVRKDAETALRVLEGAQARWPASLLREEREALMIHSLIGLSRFDEAQRRLSEFDGTFPDSFFQPALKHAFDEAQ